MAQRVQVTIEGELKNVTRLGEASLTNSLTPAGNTENAGNPPSTAMGGVQPMPNVPTMNATQQMPNVQAMGMQNQSTGTAIGNGTRQVVAVRKSPDGDINLFQLDDGRVLDYNGCLNSIHSGELNLIAAPGKSGRLSIRSVADGDPTNNLDSLPTF